MKSKPTYINKKNTHIQKSIYKTLSLFIERKGRLKGNCCKQQFCDTSSKNLIEKKEISNPVYQLPNSIPTLTLLIFDILTRLSIFF
jgi:hypothetical protein